MSTARADPDRVLDFAGIHNFRDYGGYAASGGRLRTRRLFRSAQHRAAIDADLERVERLGLLAVIDLRGEGERARDPCRRSPGFTGRVVFVDGDTAGLAPHLAAAGGVADAAQAAASMCRGYAAMPFRPKLLEILRFYFEVLATEDGPTLVHCAAGKDRTGLAVALLHALLGVHHDDIIADYMMTNLAGRQEERFTAAATAIRRYYGPELNDDAVRVLMSVAPDYIEAAFAAIRERHGTIDAYLEHEMGVTPSRKEQIARLLLV